MIPYHVDVINRSDIKPNLGFVGGKAKGVTFHMTGNRSIGADAAAHHKYLQMGDPGKKSWHITNDDREAWQHLSLDEQGWHAGDGSGPGNTTTIGLEICMNTGIDQLAAYDNAAQVTAMLVEAGHAEPNYYQHHDWSGKDCPELIRAEEGRWEWLLKRIEFYRAGGDAMDPQFEEMIWLMADILSGRPPANSSNAHGDRLAALRAEWGRDAPLAAAVRKMQRPHGHILPERTVGMHTPKGDYE